MKLAAFLLALALPASAHAALTVKNGGGDGALRTSRVSFTTGDTGSTAPIPNVCSSWRASFVAGTGGVANVYALQSSTQAVTSGTLLTTFSSSAAEVTEIETAWPYIAVNIGTAPSGNTTATLYLYCVWEGAGGLKTWFGALNLADPRMRSAVNQATWEWHHWAVDDIRPEYNAFFPVEANDWQSSYNPTTGSCVVGAESPGNILFIYDFSGGETCASAAGGGGDFGLLCKCGDLDGMTYGGVDMSQEPQSFYWVTAVQDGGGGLGQQAALYNTDLINAAYAKPMLRLDMYDADSCVTIESVNKPVTFQSRDQPVLYVEITPWNWNAQFPEMVNAVENTIAFTGWKIDSVGAVTPGFNHYVDPAVSGTATLIEADLSEAFGFLWVDSKWYMVWIADGAIAQADLILDPVATYGSMLAYLNDHMGGSVAFMVQTDVDDVYGGRKRGAYQVTNENDSTNWHSQFKSFTMGTGGSPETGFNNSGGVGQTFHRVVSACMKSAYTPILNPSGRWFVNQMDIIK